MQVNSLASHPSPTPPAVLVPPTAVRTISGTARVYVVAGDHVEERIVTAGQPAGGLVEITTGVKNGDIVATSNVEQLTDGARVSERK